MCWRQILKALQWWQEAAKEPRNTSKGKGSAVAPARCQARDGKGATKGGSKHGCLGRISMGWTFGEGEGCSGRGGGGGGAGETLPPSLPGSRKEVAEVGRKPQPETEGMLMMPAVVRRPYRDLMGDIMGGTRSGAAFLRRCRGTGSEASACSNPSGAFGAMPHTSRWCSASCTSITVPVPFESHGS